MLSWSKTGKHSIMNCVVVVALLCLVFLPEQTHTYCLPSENCWPSNQDVGYLDGNLTGNVLLPDDPDYDELVTMKNGRVTKSPNIVVFVNTTTDVQTTVKFARLYNVRVRIQSSGHDFIGRSTCDDCILINLVRMKEIQVDLGSSLHADGVVAVQSGCIWIDIYKKVDEHNRVVLGGSAHTVSPGGYTLGGGHSPISRSHGLAVDNILEFEMVTVVGDLVTTSASGTDITYENGTVSSSANTDLFWALRGGGGGTFGVVTKFTFKLHPPPAEMVKFECFYVLEYDGMLIGYNMLKIFTDLLQNLPTGWGGYMVILGAPVEQDMYGLLMFVLNHYGTLSTQDKEYLQPIYSICPNHNFTYYNSFLEYEQTIVDDPQNWLYTFNTLMSANDFTPSWREFIIENSLNPPTLSVFGCTGTLIGGKTAEVGTTATAVHPAFRSSVISLTCYNLVVCWSVFPGHRT